MKLGDAVEVLAKPIAKAIGMKKPCGACAKRKAWLNRLWDKITSWFKPKPMTCAERREWRRKIAQHNLAWLKDAESKGLAKFENGKWWVKKPKPSAPPIS